MQLVLRLPRRIPLSIGPPNTGSGYSTRPRNARQTLYGAYGVLYTPFQEPAINQNRTNASQVPTSAHQGNAPSAAQCQTDTGPNLLLLRRTHWLACRVTVSHFGKAAYWHLPSTWWPKPSTSSNGELIAIGVGPAASRATQRELSTTTNSQRRTTRTLGTGSGCSR